MWCLVVAAALAVVGPANAGHYQAGSAEAAHYQDAGQAPIADARQAVLAAPETIVEIDTGKLKGDPGMLAWSPDGKAMYVQMIERDRKGIVTSTKHYVVVIAGKTIAAADSQPPWAGKYWAWKAAPASPAAASFKIVPSEREEVKRAVAPVGELAKGGGAGSGGPGIAGSTVGEAMSAAATAQKLHIWALAINGETIGEWVNEGVTPGSNFGWAPAPVRLIVYARRDGGPLTLLDGSGRKQALAGAKNASFPAWSEDGARIAWLEKRDRRKYDLVVADLSTKK